MFDAIRRMFSRSGEAGDEAPAQSLGEAIEYKGFHIFPQPLKQGSGFLTSGLIVHDTEQGRREHKFVRADTHASADEARQFTVLKAQRLIDEQGERLFQ